MFPDIIFICLFVSTVFFLNRQLSPEDLAQVPANSTSNILNRLMVSYDPRIRPNFQGNAAVHTDDALDYLVYVKIKEKKS